MLSSLIRLGVSGCNRRNFWLKPFADYFELMEWLASTLAWLMTINGMMR